MMLQSVMLSRQEVEWKESASNFRYLNNNNAD